MGLQDTGCEVVTTKLFPFELFVTVLQSTILLIFSENPARGTSLGFMHRLLKRFAVTLPHVLVPQSENTSKWHNQATKFDDVTNPLESASLGFKIGGQITTVFLF